MIKAIKNKAIVKFANDKAWQDCIDFGEGQKIYIEGSLHVERHAHSVGTVVSSGIDGIEDGETIGVSYQAMSDYKWINDRERIFLNQINWDNETYFVIEKRDVICKIKDGVYEKFGDYVLLKGIDHESKSELVTFGVETRLSDNKKAGEALFVCGDIPAKENDVCLFEEKFRSEYSFGWKNDFVVLNKDLIYAVRN